MNTPFLYFTTLHRYHSKPGLVNFSGRSSRETMETLKKEFPNARIDFLHKHPSLGIIAAFGSRTCILLSHNLEILQRHLDTNRDERFYCCEFADLSNGDALVNRSTYNSPESLNVEAGNSAALVQETTPHDLGPDGISLTDDNDIFLGDSSSSIGEQQEAPAGGESNVTNILLIAGESGIVKMVNLQNGRVTGYLKGHTGAIHSLKVSGNILISCSEDSTIRLWNLHTYCCIGVLGGLFGHKDHVLDVDVNCRRGYIVSVGTDATVKQWAVNFAALMAFPHNLIYKPKQNFTNIHRSAITKVAYYGDLIISLCNCTVIAVYNNSDLEKLHELNTKNINACFSSEDPIYIGSIDFYEDCKTFTIHRHLLIGLSSGGDVYLFDLRKLSEETTPYIIETKLEGAEDIVLLNEHIYISTGRAVHYLPFDITRFDDVID